jgi:hypothetical protein
MKKLMWAVPAIALAVTTSLSAQQPAPPKPAPPKPAPEEKPAPQEKPAATTGAEAQPKTAPDVPTGELALGSVRITKAVTADGKALKPGTYQVRLTAEEAKPPAVGQTEPYERWVEFVQGGQVRGREVVSIVPSAEIAQVADDSPPRPGGNKVQLLKGNDYLRVWINRGGTHYLIHLPTSATTM